MYICVKLCTFSLVNLSVTLIVSLATRIYKVGGKFFLCPPTVDSGFFLSRCSGLSQAKRIKTEVHIYSIYITILRYLLNSFKNA